MSIGKRLIDLAKANLNALLERAAGDTPLDDLTDSELEAELARRKQRRLREAEEKTIRESAERAARVRAAERATAAAAQKKSGGPSPKSPPPKSSTGKSRRPPAPPGSERRLRELYSQLEVPYGAPFAEVKASFRRLMRKYHPDLHTGDPKLHQTATQLTMSLTQAYNELELHLVGGPNKR